MLPYCLLLHVINFSYQGGTVFGLSVVFAAQLGWSQYAKEEKRHI
jgi:hypothetical protein